MLLVFLVVQIVVLTGIKVLMMFQLEMRVILNGRKLIILMIGRLWLLVILLLPRKTLMKA